MPSHSSHLLQPLDVACFSPLKKAYGYQVENRMRLGINHITKLDFLPAFRQAHKEAITEANIRGSFAGAGLVPFDPDRVLSGLSMRIRTPTPPASQGSPWTSKTPRNPIELQCQTELIKDRFEYHPDGSPTPANQALIHLSKGCQTAMQSVVLLAAENKELRAANERQKRKRSKRKRRIDQGKVLGVREGQDHIQRTTIDEQIQNEIHQGGAEGEGSK